MIELKNVSYAYNEKPVLVDISCSISKGERIVLLGVNGCGKSTLLKIIGGLIFPDKGTYTFKDRVIDRSFFKNEEYRRSFRRSVGVLFQSPDVMLFNPTVYDEIAFSLRQISENELLIKEKVEHWIDLLNIKKYERSFPLELSGGEKQKVALASILVIEPELLLLDEPMANLDPRSQGEIIDLLYDLNITTIISTHNLSLAPELGERTILLSEDHRILFDGGINELLNNEEILINANLVHKHRHRHKETYHSHYHRH